MNKYTHHKKLLDECFWTQEQCDILFGTLLGDASLQTQNQGRTYRYKFLQSDIHASYFHSTISALRPWMHKESRYSPARNVWENETLAHSKWILWNQMFYTPAEPRRSKKVPEDEDLQKFLTPRAIAHWYMDDGGVLAKNSKGLCFYTQGFKLPEVQRLSAFLKQAYKWECWVKFNKSKPVIAVSGKDFESTRALLLPYLHPSMIKKFPTKRKRS